MKKYILFILISLIYSGIAFGQSTEQKPDTKINNLKKNQIYVEVGGNSAIISLNYERVLPLGQKTGLGFRIGAGTAGSVESDTTKIAITGLAEINFLYGKSKNYFEAGLGYTFGFNEPLNWCSIRIGYRYQAKKGFLFRIAPMYIYNFEELNGNDDVFKGIWLGASFGYSF